MSGSKQFIIQDDGEGVVVVLWFKVIMSYNRQFRIGVWLSETVIITFGIVTFQKTHSFYNKVFHHRPVTVTKRRLNHRKNTKIHPFFLPCFLIGQNTIEQYTLLYLLEINDIFSQN